MSRTELSESLKDTAGLAAGDTASANGGSSKGDPLDAARAEAFSRGNSNRFTGGGINVGSLELVSPFENYKLAQVGKDGLPAPDRLTQLRVEAKQFLNQENFAKAKELLDEELKLLKEKASKDRKPEEGFEFAQAYTRLGHCLTALSKRQGSKEAEVAFDKATFILDKEIKAKDQAKPSGQDRAQDPKEIEASKRNAAVNAAELERLREYRAAAGEEKGCNAFLLANTAEQAKDAPGAKAYYEKSETALSDSLKVLDSPKYQDNPVRLRALMNLAQTELALGKKDASAKIMEKINSRAEQVASLQEVRIASDKLFRGGKYKEAEAPLREEIKLLQEQAKKEGKKEEGVEFLRPYARLANCLTETSAKKGNKEADGLFEKAVSILDNFTAETPEGKQQQQDYRALLQENRGSNAFDLAVAAKTAHNEPEAKLYYEKAEKAFSDTLSVLKGPESKNDPVRVRAAIGLTETESVLGKHDAALTILETIKDHPFHSQFLTDIKTNFMHDAIDKAKSSSPTLRLVDEKFNALPWKPSSIMVPTTDLNKPDSGYDSNKSRLHLTSRIPDDMIPQKYANMAYVGTHQSLYEKFRGDIKPGAKEDVPVDLTTFQRLKREQIAGGFAKEIIVASELHVNTPINYKAGNETKDLKTLAVKKEGTQEIDFEKTRAAIAQFIERDQVAHNDWAQEYKPYVDNYARNKKAIFPILKPEL